MTDFFKFENKELDFPFYNGNPKLSKFDWLMFLLVPVSVIFLISGYIYYIPMVPELPSQVDELLFCIIPLFFCTCACRGKLDLFFKKPKIKDFKTIILCFIGYFLYTIMIIFVLSNIGHQATGNPIIDATTSIRDIIFIIIQLVGEELFKISVFIIGMTLLYHFTDNRKWSIIFGSVASLIIFGLNHIPAYGDVLHCLFVIGVGSLFHLYPYIKTKNILNTYILHILIDLTAIGITLLG